MAKEAVFVVTLTPAPTVAVTLNYTTRDGTAVAPTNYTTRSGVLNFAIGEASKEVTVPVFLPLPVGSPDELFYLDVTWPTGSANTISRSPGICTLPGTATPPSLPSVSISNPTVV
jgi:chitinase